jgi:hypothetical protein
MTEHFAGGSRLEDFLELISNQIQLSAREREIEQRDQERRDTTALVMQTEALRLKVLNQRQALNILVEGV